MASKSLGLPPTRQGLVVVNGILDRNLFSELCAKKDGGRLPFGSETDHGIATHELCFSRVHQNRSIRFNEPEISVFSSFNGFKGDEETPDEQRVRFIGVSQTMISKPFHGNGHLSMSAGGVVRIFNTGKDTFEIGDKVMWAIPRNKDEQTSIRDISSTKIYPVLKPYQMPDIEEIRKEVFQGLPNCENESVQKTIVKKILKNLKAFESRVIGIALSRARSGEAFDVLMRFN